MKQNIKTTELRLSGSGGQGLITAGILLAKAAVLDGINASQTQSYGPESRGGASRADVIISDSAIYYPEATHFDILLAMTQEACDKYLDNLKNGGILIADTSFIKNIPLVNATVYEVQFTEKTREALASVLSTNIVALAFLVRKTKIVSEKSLKKVVGDFKPRFAEMNMKAIKLGFSLADKYENSNGK